MNHVKAQKILGIDVDENLIKVAAESKYPNNPRLVFKHCDITEDISVIQEYLRQENIEKFDMIFCFSVTMWIHLNKGEQGLLKLFEHCNSLTKKWLILEPQPWKCYMTAARRMRKLKEAKFEHLDNITNRQENLLPYLISVCERVGFKLVSQLGQTNWERKIFLFEKISQEIKENV